MLTCVRCDSSVSLICTVRATVAKTRRCAHKVMACKPILISASILEINVVCLSFEMNTYLYFTQIPLRINSRDSFVGRNNRKFYRQRKNIVIATDNAVIRMNGER